MKLRKTQTKFMKAMLDKRRAETEADPLERFKTSWEGLDRHQRVSALDWLHDAHDVTILGGIELLEEAE